MRDPKQAATALSKECRAVAWRAEVQGEWRYITPGVSFPGGGLDWEPLYDEAALRALVERVCEISGEHDCTKHSFGPADPCDCKGAIIAAIRTELGGADA